LPDQFGRIDMCTASKTGLMRDDSRSQGVASAFLATALLVDLSDRRKVLVSMVAGLDVRL
jgi:hypothetical protein